jgi:hypothetical protein
VRAGIEKYAQLEFHAVVPLLKSALARDLTESDREQALAYLGRTFASFRKPRRAEKIFVDLLRLDPEFDITPSESPLIRNALIRARAIWATTPDPSPPEAVESPPVEPVLQLPPELPPVEPALQPPNEEEKSDDPPKLSTTTWWLVGIGTAAVAAGMIGLAVTEPWTDEPRRVGTLGAWDLP